MKFNGVASTPKIDTYNTSIDWRTATFNDTIPLLYQHDSNKLIGRATLSKNKDNKSIDFTAETLNTEEIRSQYIKNVIIEAEDYIKTGGIDGVSVGMSFEHLEVQEIDENNILLKNVVIRELSVVSVPANDEALITAIRSYKPSKEANRNSFINKESNMQNKILEIKTRLSEIAQQQAMFLELKDVEGNTRSMNEEEVAQEADLQRQANSLQQSLRVAESVLATQSRVSEVVKHEVEKERTIQSTTFSGSNVADELVIPQLIRATLLAKREGVSVKEVAARSGYSTQVRNVVGLSVGNFGIDFSNATSAFIDLLARNSSALAYYNALPNKLPFYSRIAFFVQDLVDGLDAVEEGGVKPSNAFTGANQTLTIQKIAGLITLTDELETIGGAELDRLIISRLQQSLDTQLAKYLFSGVTNGPTDYVHPMVNRDNTLTEFQPLPAAVDTVIDANVDTDPLTALKTLITRYVNSGYDVSRAVFIINDKVATALATINLGLNAANDNYVNGINFDLKTKQGTIFGIKAYSHKLVRITNSVSGLSATAAYLVDTGYVVAATPKEALARSNQATIQGISLFETNQNAYRLDFYCDLKFLGNGASSIGDGGGKNGVGAVGTTYSSLKAGVTINAPVTKAPKTIKE